MTTIQYRQPDHPIDDAELAAAAFLARYSGRTLEAYRHDLRGFFQWASNNGVVVLEATRPHIELFGASMEVAVWRPRRSTGGSRRCAGSTGSLISTAGSDRTLPSTSAGRRSTPRTPAVWIAPSSACSSSPPSSTTASTPCSRCCSDSTDCESARRVPPTSKTSGSNEVTGRCASLARGTSPRNPAGSPHRPHDRSRCRGAPRGSDPAPTRRTAARPAHGVPVGALDRQARRARARPPAHARAAFIMAALDAGVPLRDVQTAARHSDPRTTTIYDRRRQNFDRHAAYVVVAFVAGG